MPYLRDITDGLDLFRAAEVVDEIPVLKTSSMMQDDFKRVPDIASMNSGTVPDGGKVDEGVVERDVHGMLKVERGLGNVMDGGKFPFLWFQPSLLRMHSSHGFFTNPDL